MIEISIAFALVCGAALLFHREQLGQWRAERTELLDRARSERKDLEDRLMAKDWTEHRAMTREVTDVEIPQMTTDELEAKWYEAKAREAA